MCGSIVWRIYTPFYHAAERCCDLCVIEKTDSPACSLIPLKHLFALCCG
uniref:Uncharacterized protein n=1 Tax=Anguilla anguilla TaxID=7936 RepID=A0A0E9QCU5_ANGAN